MKRRYKITIALLTYNRCEMGYLRESLEAILAQSYTDFELMVVDNHSTDKTAEFVMSYDDPRLTYIRQPPGGNATFSYIRSSLMGRGEYIIMAHDDDIMEPGMIKRQLEFIEKYPDLLVVSNNVSLIDDAGNLIQPKLYDLKEDQVFDTAEYIKRYFEEKLWLPAPTLLFKREAYVRAVSRWLGTTDPEYLASGDLWILFTLNLQGPIGLLAEPLLRYRQHGGQESRNVDQGYPMIEAIQLLLKNHGRKKNLKPHLPAIHAFFARFRTQDIFFKSNTKNQLKKKLATLKKRWEKAVSPENRALDTIIPFEISLFLMGLEFTVPIEEFRKLELIPAKGGARRGFRAWLNVVHQGKNLFGSKPNFKKIAVFGSMLNSYLIAESADIAGIEVLGCFDSSPARIEKHVFNILVFPMGELTSRAEELDAIILSSEHDQEDALKRILNEYLKQNQKIPIISWKELAHDAAEMDI